VLDLSAALPLADLMVVQTVVLPREHLAAVQVSVLPQANLEVDRFWDSPLEDLGVQVSDSQMEGSQGVAWCLVPA
jgi:hypothetical protein